MGHKKKAAAVVASGKVRKNHCRCHHHKHHGHLLSLLALGALAAAIHKELSKPAHSREWHGHVAGVVPYDLRVPTVDKIKDRVLNPDGPVIVPTTFGVGWDANLGRIAKEVRSYSESRNGDTEGTE